MSDDAAERSTERNLDGTTTEYFDVPPAEATYRELVRVLFEDHWSDIDFGPCLQGAVFELRFGSKPRVGYLDGYFTIGPDEPGAWHFHLCVGDHKGTKARPTPPELARWRQCARAAFYRDGDADGRARSWGLRLWNGRNEQMMTVFFPNPWLNPERTKPVKEPDWSRLALWMDLRARFAGVPPEPAPVDDPRRPRMCG